MWRAGARANARAADEHSMAHSAPPAPHASPRGVYFANDATISLSYAGHPSAASATATAFASDPLTALGGTNMKGPGTLAICEIINEPRYQRPGVARFSGLPAGLRGGAASGGQIFVVDDPKDIVMRYVLVPATRL